MSASVVTATPADAGAVAAWAFPAAYAAVAVLGAGWGLVLRARRPQVFAAIGLGASAVTAQHTPGPEGVSR